MNLNQVTLPATDVDRSAAFYRRMGFTQIVRSSPEYARFECSQGESTFSVHKVDKVAADSGVVIYFECMDLDQQVDLLQQRGFVFEKLPTEEPWLWREARLRDPDGNVICLFQAGENRKNPPWRVTMRDE